MMSDDPDRADMSTDKILSLLKRSINFLVGQKKMPSSRRSLDFTAKPSDLKDEMLSGLDDVGKQT